MNTELQDRWRRRRQPFSGVILISPELALPDLAAELRAVTGFLKSQTKSSVFVLDDWHEHDGFVNTARAADWGEVESWMADGRSVFAARTGDFDVRRGIFPDDYLYYLRFYVDCDEDYNKAQGKWDLTAEVSLVESLSAQALIAHGGEYIAASEYFDCSYGG